MIETFITLAESTLGSPAGNADATLTLAAGAAFNVPGQYRLRLDDSLQQPGGIPTRLELCRATFNAGNVVNAFRSGADLEGSTAQAWPAGTKVVAVVTAAALKTLRNGPGAIALQIQAGTLAGGAVAANAEVDYTVTLPIAWPTAHLFFAVTLTAPTSTWAGVVVRGGNPMSLSQGSFHYANGATAQSFGGWNWLSVGY